jgi:hypothetical protein
MAENGRYFARSGSRKGDSALPPSVDARDSVKPVEATFAGAPVPHPSGCLGGPTKNHILKVQSVKDGTHNVIVYCKANAGRRIVDVIEALRSQGR